MTAKTLCPGSGESVCDYEPAVEQEPGSDAPPAKSKAIPLQPMRSTKGVLFIPCASCGQDITVKGPVMTMPEHNVAGPDQESIDSFRASADSALPPEWRGGE